MDPPPENRALRSWAERLLECHHFACLDGFIRTQDVIDCPVPCRLRPGLTQADQERAKTLSVGVEQLLQFAQFLVR